jgi:aspartate carbamoyltransferase regulatory subunit
MMELKVSAIKNGTVIDHITSGMALKVLKIMSIMDSNVDSTLTVAMHVPSKKGGWKDIVKIEDRELDAKEVNKIALIAPSATINIIRNYNVAEKHIVDLPDVVVGIVRCANPTCITNSKEPREPVETQFILESKDPPKLKCKYCEREVEDTAAQII